jgi:hypothetical protein
MSSLRLSELLVGLSRIADIGMGFEPGEAARVRRSWTRPRGGATLVT